MIGMSPAPTPAPRRRYSGNVFERQEVFSEGPATCGYNTEDVYDPVTCDSGSTCLFNTASEWFGCCSNEAACATIYTWCVPGSEVSVGTERSDTIYCTEGTSTECVMFQNVQERMATTYTKYGCGDTEFTSVIYYDPTNAPSGDAGLTPTTTSPTSPTSPTPPAGTGSGTVVPPADSPSSTPIGAIIGGVIGGIAVLAVIGVGAFLFIRRKKKAAAPSPVQYGQPEYMGGQSHMPASMASPMTQHPLQNAGDYKSPVAIPTPMSPSPPYQPPYSPPPQTYYNPPAPNISQLP